MRKAACKVRQAACGVGRRYSVDDADRSLVLVRRIVADIVTDYARLVDLQEAAEAARSPAGVQAARAEVAQLVERLQRALEELEFLGLELKDWSVGVVDFPGVADGREIRLTWRLGDQAIRSWHEIHCPTLQSIETIPIVDAQTVER